MPHARVLGITACLSAAALGACGGNNSNPQLTLTSAQIQGDHAQLGVSVSNPSGYELELTGLEYELVYGPLPVGSGSWSGSKVLPAGESAAMQLSVELDGPVLDPNAESATLTGGMELGGGEGGEMTIKASSYESTVSVDHD